MSSNRSDDDTLFNWPPAPAEMDRIAVLDVARPPQPPPETLTELPPPAHVRKSRRRAHMSRRRRVLRAPRDPWLTLAAGMIIGMVLPGLLQVRPAVLPTAHAEGQLPDTTGTHAATNEVVALRAMQALLRGDVVTARTPAGLVEPAASAPTAGASLIAAPSTPANPAAAAPASASETPPAVVSTAVPLPERGEPIPIRKRSRRAAARDVAPAVIAPLDARDLEVRSVLQAYERAWTRMDVAATRSLWPSADVDRVQAAFDPVREQRLELAACDIGLHGDRALAVCLGTRRFLPRAGSTVAQVERGRWEFELERSDSGWQISAVDKP